MSSQGRRSYLRIVLAVSLFLGTLLIQARPAFAFAEDWLTSTLTGWPVDSKMRTVTGVYFQLTGVKKDQVRNFEGRIEVDGPDTGGGGTLVFGVVNCYKANKYTAADTEWVLGSGSGVNWPVSGTYARQNVAVMVHNMFRAPADGDYTCRLGILFGSSAGHTMKIIGGQTKTWLHLGDVTYTDPTSRSYYFETSGLTESPDFVIGPRGTAGEPTSYTWTKEHNAGTPGSGRAFEVFADTYLTTCYTAGPPPDCAGDHNPTGNALLGSVIDTYVTVTRLTGSGGGSCGQVSTANGTTTRLPTAARQHTIDYYSHHLMVHHVIQVSLGSTSGCSGYFKVSLTMIYRSGNSIRIEGGRTSQTEACSGCPSHKYAQTIINGIRR
ncbi:MAG: hypothetical protein WAT66_16235 [Actinomycetota bacterium]